MIEAFLITNGRATSEYALKALCKQRPKIKVTTVKDMKWVDAVNRCWEICESKYYARIDDDMYMHPYAIEYMLFKIKKHKNCVVHTCRLWEDWQNKISGYVKVYNRNIVKKLGGFKVNKLGKCDKPFTKTVSKSKYFIKKDKSVVGIHGSDWEGTKKYRKLWINQNAKVFHEEPKEIWESRKKYTKPIKDQYKLIKILYKKNFKVRSDFYKFVKIKTGQAKKKI